MFLHNYNTLGLLYGDPALYNHAKQEFHKRNAGIGSTGTILRTDSYISKFLNSNAIYNNSYAAANAERLGITDDNKYVYGETMNTAVIQDVEITSVYYNSILKTFDGDEAKAKAYMGMEEADGQALITFDAYRSLSIAENLWGNEQERLFRKIVKGEKIDPNEVEKFFPVRKYQYWGPLQTGGRLPLIGFHKFSVMPLIPSMIKGTKAEVLHDKMLQENIQYLTFSTGSKVSSMQRIRKGEDGKPTGELDQIFKKNSKDEYTGELVDEMSVDNTTMKVFTKNTINLKYLKNQLSIADKDKSSVVFSTQLRKLVEDGLMENNVPTDFRPDVTNADERLKLWEDVLKLKDQSQWTENYKLLKSFEKNIQALANLYKTQLLREVGLEFNEDNGQYEGDLSGLINLIKKELKDDLPDHALDFIETKGGAIKQDLSLSFYAADIEKLLNRVLVKRLVESKVNGEALVQVANTLFDSKDNMRASFRNPTKDDLYKYGGTNDLRGYRQDPETGKTLAIDVKVSLRGKFKKLLDLEYKGRRIGDLDTLNEAITDEEWLDKGDHRAMITMTAVRIPVQGLNSMEFMQVRKFLPAEAGNIIIAPSEVVAKSGADFDVDKMTVMMPNIDRKVNKAKLTNQFLNELQEQNPELDFSRDNVQMILDIVESSDFDYTALRDQQTESLVSRREGDQLMIARRQNVTEEIPVYQLTEEDKQIYDIINARTITEVTLPKGDFKSGIENRIIQNIVDILSLERNYKNLITPNSTDLYNKPIPGSKLASKESLVDSLGQYTRGDLNYTTISPTDVLTYRYNLNKHQENKIGKEALGLGAADRDWETSVGLIVV